MNWLMRFLLSMSIVLMNVDGSSRLVLGLVMCVVIGFVMKVMNVIGLVVVVVNVSRVIVLRMSRSCVVFIWMLRLVVELLLSCRVFSVWF